MKSVSFSNLKVSALLVDSGAIVFSIVQHDSRFDNGSRVVARE
jgi:hypothetical protein